MRATKVRKTTNMFHLRSTVFDWSHPPFPTASEKSVLTSRSSNQLSIGEDVKMDEKKMS